MLSVLKNHLQTSLNSKWSSNETFGELLMYALMFCRFATLETNGLLFYNGRFNEKHDFLALEILDGQVVLKYSTGKKPISVYVCWTNI